MHAFRLCFISVACGSAFYCSPFFSYIAIRTCLSNYKLSIQFLASRTIENNCKMLFLFLYWHGCDIVAGLSYKLHM